MTAHICAIKLSPVFGGMRAAWAFMLTQRTDRTEPIQLFRDENKSVTAE